MMDGVPPTNITMRCDVSVMAYTKGSNNTNSPLNFATYAKGKYENTVGRRLWAGLGCVVIGGIVFQFPIMGWNFSLD